MTQLLPGIPITATTPTQFDAPLPKVAEVVVIGGGVIGVSTALFLARAGQRVVLLEKGRLAGEQSGRNWGWIRQQGRDPDELPIMMEANRHWQALARETNVDIGLRQGGVTYLADSEKDLARYEAWLTSVSGSGVDSRMLSGDEVGALIPGMSQRYAGALHTASDLRAEPWVTVPALGQIAVREGAVLRENCAVRRLEITGGRVSAVLTEAGRVAVDAVVLAGGAWSGLFLQAHGVRLPQLSVRSTVAATAPLPATYQGGAADSKIAFRARADGGYSLAAGGFHELFVGPDAFRSLSHFLVQLSADPFGTRFLPAAPKGYPDAWRTARHWTADDITPFEQMRVLNPGPNRGKVRTLADRFAKLFPGFGQVKLTHAWGGMIDTMPDIVPVVDHVPQLPGLVVGTGMSGHGFGIGPGMGRVLADLVMGKPVGHDLSRFRFDRFTDGTKMRLGPAL